MEEVVISVNHVSKNFNYNSHRSRTLKSLFTGLVSRKNRSGSDIQHALEDVTFDIRQGEFFGIVGRNGSGKSTLLKMIAGIYQPNQGSIKVRGKLVPFIELGVGFNPELTGKENVYLNGALLGFSKVEIDNQYQEIVEFAELELFMDQQLKNYSSGMQVRLAFSMAIRAQADILLIDEVLAVGDSDFQRKCYDYFKQLKNSNKTVVFVSHDMGAVQQYCDRALLIEKSKVVQIGTPTTISTQYSKMFIENKDNKKVRKTKLSPSGEERWGDKMAEWTKVRTKLLKNDKADLEVSHIEITATGQTRQPIDHPILGFSVKDVNFQQLAGTNTIRRRKILPALKAGDIFSVTWVVPNIFNTGDYYVDCTIAHDQAGMVSDRWPEASSFSISRVEENPYPVYPPGIECKYNKIEGKV